MATEEKQPESNFKRPPKWVIAGFVLVFAAVGIYALTLSRAAPKAKPGGGTTSGSAQLYLADVPADVTAGSTVTVAVRLNPPSNVDGVESTITYNPSQLQFVAINSTDSAFPAKLMETGGSGTVQITRGIFAPNTISTDSLVSTVSFKTLKGTKSSQLQIQGKATAQGSYLPALTTADASLRIR